MIPLKLYYVYTPLRFPLRLHPQESAELLRVGAALVVGEVQEARHALCQAVGDLVHPEEATQEAEPARGWGGYNWRGSIWPKKRSLS